jgi:hypothetical protein
MLADVFGGRVAWRRGRDPIGREVPEAGVAPPRPPVGGSRSGDDDDVHITTTVAVDVDEDRNDDESASGGDDDGVRRVRGSTGEAACDTAQLWIGDILVASVTHADDSWQMAGDLERDRGVIFQIAAASTACSKGGGGGRGAGVHYGQTVKGVDGSGGAFDVDAMAAETHAGLLALGRSGAEQSTLRLSLSRADVDAAAASGSGSPEAVTLAHPVRVFLSHLRLLSGGAEGNDARRAHTAGITDDQAARCAYILKVAAWGNSCTEVTLRDCVLVQYFAARPGLARTDLNVLFQAFAWREATGKEAECAAVSALAVQVAAELVEAAVRGVEQAHATCHGLGGEEMGTATEAATPYSDDVTNLVDRLLAAAGSKPGTETREEIERGTDIEPGMGTGDSEGGWREEAQRRTVAYAEVVRDRALRLLAAGAKVPTIEKAMRGSHARLTLNGSKKQPTDGSIAHAGAPLVLVTLVAPPDAGANGPHAKERNTRMCVGDVGALVGPYGCPQSVSGGNSGTGGSGEYCVADWWGFGVEAAVNWSDVELVPLLQARP